MYIFFNEEKEVGEDSWDLKLLGHSFLMGVTISNSFVTLNYFQETKVPY